VYVNADPSAPKGKPKYYSAAQVDSLQAQLEEARAGVEAANRRAAESIAIFQQQYPAKLQFPYGSPRYEKPFLVRSIWHDGQFTYIKSDATELPALYETKDGKPIPTSKVHFGYTDGISMTTIRGGPERYPPDHQQPCEPWLFVLQDEAENYFVPEPRELGLNGSFAVFKQVETDVVGFEDFLQSKRDEIDAELLAAKMCGRWRNGVPLELSPDTDSPTEGISLEQLNEFEYVNADGSGDPKGLRCPVGAHIRRVNPRGSPVAGQGVPGGSNNAHRIIRRGLPYGPTFDPKEPYDGIERGMLFQFINANIENQYEFVLRRWVNDSEFAGAVRLHPRSKDPLTGTQDPAESIFVIPQPDGTPPIEVTGFSSFMTTRAAAYVFLPSITAIRLIANLGLGD
jgi:hypothetical protein